MRAPAFPVALLGAALAACAPAARPTQASTSFLPSLRSVQPGQVFELKVLHLSAELESLRDWDPSEVPRLRLEETAADYGGPLAVRSFRAAAIALADVELPDRTTIRVVPALDPAAPGAAEWPDRLPRFRTPPAQYAAWIAAVGMACGLAFVLLLRLRARSEPAPVRGAPAAPSAAAIARARLALLDPRAPRSAAEISAFHAAASAILREHLEQAAGIPAPRRTTEETDAAAAVALAAPVRAQVAAALAACDRVKFASRLSSAEERIALLAGLDALFAEGGP